MNPDGVRTLTLDWDADPPDVGDVVASYGPRARACYLVLAVLPNRNRPTRARYRVTPVDRAAVPEGVRICRFRWYSRSRTLNRRGGPECDSAS